MPFLVGSLRSSATSDGIIVDKDELAAPRDHSFCEAKSLKFVSSFEVPQDVVWFNIDDGSLYVPPAYKSVLFQTGLEKAIMKIMKPISSHFNHTFPDNGQVEMIHKSSALTASSDRVAALLQNYVGLLIGQVSHCSAAIVSLGEIVVVFDETRFVSLTHDAFCFPAVDNHSGVASNNDGRAYNDMILCEPSTAFLKMFLRAQCFSQHVTESAAFAY
jgi:hypothetical protein